jgi:hypothetical protein
MRKADHGAARQTACRLEFTGKWSHCTSFSTRQDGFRASIQRGRDVYCKSIVLGKKRRTFKI